MSVKQQGIVWELDLPQGEAWVLMALADHADHEGKGARPGVELLAWKTGYSERNVTRLLKKLEKKKLIVPVRGGDGRGYVQEYDLDLSQGTRKASRGQKVDKLSSFSSAKGGQSVPLSATHKVDNLSTLPERKGGQIEPERVTNETLKGDKSGSAPIRTARVEPPMSHHEPSGVCVARAHETSASSDEAPEEITETDVAEYLRACRPDIEFPESYAQRAIVAIRAGKWTNVADAVRSWQAALAAERQSLLPDAPAEEGSETQVQASALVRALFLAKGWVIETPTPQQWHEAKLAEAQLAVYANSATPSLPELVAAAGKCYAGRVWRLSYLVMDWPQLYPELRKTIAANGHAAAAEPTPRNEVWQEQWAREDDEAAFDKWWNDTLSETARAERTAEQWRLIVSRLPSAKEWGDEVKAQTIRAGLLRAFNESPKGESQ